MDTGIARLSYINAHKKLSAKNKLKQEPSKDVKNSLLTKPNSDKINGYEDDLIVSGENIDEIRKQVKHGMQRRGATYSYSIPLEDIE